MRGHSNIKWANDVGRQYCQIFTYWSYFTTYKKQVHINSYHYNFAGRIFASCRNSQFLLVRRLNLISLNIINIRPQYGQWQTNNFFWPSDGKQKTTSTAAVWRKSSETGWPKHGTITWLQLKIIVQISKQPTETKASKHCLLERARWLLARLFLDKYVSWYLWDISWYIWDMRIMLLMWTEGENCLYIVHCS